jgi:ABC-2 type transport system ATP-binding protein
MALSGDHRNGRSDTDTDMNRGRSGVIDTDMDRRTNQGDQVIVAEDVVKTYGRTVAVDGITTTVESGEVFALVGPNGAGKTTFVRCLTGTVRPDSGTVELLGGPPSTVDTNRIGVLPQSFTPQGRLTPIEILRYFAGLYDDPLDPRSVLEEVGLNSTRSTWYENLSGGEKRRVAVATTLVNDPDVIFLDEPTTAIDPEGRHRLWELFESIAADGTTIVLTTHNMAEAERLADRVAFLADGTLVKTGAPSDLVQQFGGPNRLVVEATDPPDRVGKYELQETDEGYVVSGIEPEAIGTFVERLEASGTTFDALEWREPTLEDAYLSLVRNDTLREDEPT